MNSSSRKILVCTGPPLNRENDAELARRVSEYDGDVVICGGTTSQIISRELGREINVVLKRNTAGLPPTSKMDGILLITEGVITLDNVVKLLEKSPANNIEWRDSDAKLAKILLDHETIDFLVGKAVNQTHQNPALPIELEQRINLIAHLAQILEHKFMKKVKVEYL